MFLLAEKLISVPFLQKPCFELLNARPNGEPRMKPHMCIVAVYLAIHKPNNKTDPGVQGVCYNGTKGILAGVKI